MGDAASPATSGSFLRHARNYVSGSVVSGIFAFGTTAVLTRLLTPAEYGIVGVFMAMVSLFSVVVELNFRGALNRYALEKKDDFPEFLRTILIFLLIFVGLSATVLILLRRPLAEFFAVQPAVLVAAILAAAAQVPWNLNWKYQVALQESGRYARLLMLRDGAMFLAGAAATVAIAWYGYGRVDEVCQVGLAPATESDAVCGRHLGQIGGSLLVYLLFAAGIAVHLGRLAARSGFKRKHLAYALAFGVPLMPHALFGYVLSFFDRIIINQVEGERSAGLYSFAYNIGLGMGIVVNAMNQAWLPVFSDLRDRHDYGRIRKLASSYAWTVYAQALLFVLFAREIGMLLGTEEFLEALPVVPPIVFGYVGLFLYTLYSNYAFYLRRTWWISLATVLAGCINVGMNYWLIPHFGYIAAAWTTLGSYLLLFVLHLGISRGVLRERTVPLTVVLPGLLLAGGAAVALVMADRALPEYWMSVAFLKIPAAVLALWFFLRRRRRNQASTTGP